MSLAPGTRIGPHEVADVARDGRLLINTALETAAAPITLIQNWNPGGTQ